MIAQSYTVAERAAKQLGGKTTARDLRDSATISIPDHGAVAQISVRGESRQQAADRANALASSFLSYRGELAQERIISNTNNLDRRIDSLKSELARSATAAQSDPSSDESAKILSREVEALVTQRDALQSVDTTGGSILSDARYGQFQFAPDVIGTIASFTASGLLLGILAAILRDPFDNRLRRTREVEERLGAPLIARVSQAYSQSPHLDSNAIQLAAERILSYSSCARAIAVIDGPGTTEPRVAAAIAASMARRGQPVRFITSRGDSLADYSRRSNRDRQEVVPGLDHYICSVAPSHDAWADYLQQAVKGAPAGSVTIIPVATTAPAPAIHAALRCTQAHVSVVAEGADASAIVRAAGSVSGSRSLGAILLPTQFDPRSWRSWFLLPLRFARREA
jgi:capsular polysaccharide biosynthesis protein